MEGSLLSLISPGVTPACKVRGKKARSTLVKRVVSFFLPYGADVRTFGDVTTKIPRMYR